MTVGMLIFMGGMVVLTATFNLEMFSTIVLEKRATPESAERGKQSYMIGLILVVIGILLSL